MRNILKIKTGDNARTSRKGALTQSLKLKRRSFDAVAYAAAIEILG
jgi:hypothetical protein